MKRSQSTAGSVDSGHSTASSKTASLASTPELIVDANTPTSPQISPKLNPKRRKTSASVGGTTATIVEEPSREITEPPPALNSAIVISTVRRADHPQTLKPGLPRYTIREGPSDGHSWCGVCLDGRVLASTPAAWYDFFKQPSCPIADDMIDWTLSIFAELANNTAGKASQFVRTNDRRHVNQWCDTILVTPISYADEDIYALLFFEVHHNLPNSYQVDVVSYYSAEKPSLTTFRRRIGEIFPDIPDSFKLRVKTNQCTYADVFPECHARLLVLYGILALDVLATRPTTLELALKRFKLALKPSTSESEWHQTLACVQQAAFQIKAGTSFSFKLAFSECVDDIDDVEPWRDQTLQLTHPHRNNR